jgi:hypothetical protein
MNQDYSKFVRRRIRDEVLWKAFYILLTISIPIFFWLITFRHSDSSTAFLAFVGALILLVLLVTIPRWRKYYLSQYAYASNFAQAIEEKSEYLSSVLDQLNHDQLPKEVFWINFNIDPETLRIQLETHATSEHAEIESLLQIKNQVEALISISDSTITNLKKQGWSAEANIDISIWIIQIWIANTWNRVIRSSKFRATISISNKSGFFNIANSKWE